MSTGEIQQTTGMLDLESTVPTNRGSVAKGTGMLNDMPSMPGTNGQNSGQKTTASTASATNPTHTIDAILGLKESRKGDGGSPSPSTPGSHGLDLKDTGSYRRSDMECGQDRVNSPPSTLSSNTGLTFPSKDDILHFPAYRGKI